MTYEARNKLILLLKNHLIKPIECNANEHQKYGNENKWMVNAVLIFLNFIVKLESSNLYSHHLLLAIVLQSLFKFNCHCLARSKMFSYRNLKRDTKMQGCASVMDTRHQ